MLHKLTLSASAGGEVCDEQKRCNIVFTALRSPKRISRHIINHQV